MYLTNKYTTWYNSIIFQAKSRVLPDHTYTETHHIIPKSLGGDDSKDNLVKLTAREHFICHLLLPKMLTGTDKRNMTFAIWSMLHRDHSKQRSRHKVNSHTYLRLKLQVARACSDLHAGKTVSEATKKKISNKTKGRVSPNKGRSMTDEQKEKLSIAHKGKTVSDETVAKILASRKNYRHSLETKQKISQGNKGKTVKLSIETRQKISSSLKGRPNHNKGKPAFNKGVAMSDSVKQKMRESHKNREKILCQYCNKLIAKCSFSRWHGDRCKHKCSINL